MSDERSLRLIGLVKRGSLLEVSATRTEATAKDLMEDPKITVVPSDDAVLVLRNMLKYDEWYSPVIDESGRYLGIFGLENAIKYILDSDEKALLIPVSEVMQKSVVYVEPDTPIHKVWQLMRKHGFAALPVVKDGKIVGVIAEYDLLSRGYTRPDFEADSYRKGPFVYEVMSTPPVTLLPTATMRDAAELMIKRDIGRVYIVDEYKRLLGVIDRSDVVSKWLSSK